MRASELRDMSLEELEEKVKEFSEALFNLRFQNVTSQLDNTAQIRNTRKNIARAKTIIRERQITGEAS